MPRYFGGMNTDRHFLFFSTLNAYLRVTKYIAQRDTSSKRYL